VTCCQACATCSHRVFVCGVVLIVSCVLLFLLCVCLCDLFLFLHPVNLFTPCLHTRVLLSCYQACATSWPRQPSRSSAWWTRCSRSWCLRCSSLGTPASWEWWACLPVSEQVCLCVCVCVRACACVCIYIYI